MKQLKLKPVVLALGLSVFTHIAFAELSSNRAIIKNDGSQRITASVSFPTLVTGDLYVATQVNGQFLFLTHGGTEFTLDIVPLVKNSEYIGKYDLFDFSAAGIAPGRYPLYQVVVIPATNPFQTVNWVGGLAGLSSFQYSIGLPATVTNDLDNDGFSDDDKDHDGFQDQQTSATTDVVVGKSLYSENCSQCHGETPTYNHISLAVNPAKTRSAIIGDRGGMSGLSFLSDAELQEVAKYVKAVW